MATYKLVDEEKLDAAMTATADAIRAKTGSTDSIAWDAEKGMSEAVEPVFEAGKKSEYDAFWDEFQNYGNRRKYNNAFGGEFWNNITFNPKYNIIVGSDTYDADNLFSTAKIDNMEKVFNDNKIILDTSNAVRLHGVFDGIQTIAIPIIDFKNCESSLKTFYNTTLLKLTVINIKKSCTFDRTFNYNLKLKDLYITGEIGNSITFTGCYSLTKDSIQNIVNALSTSASGLTVTFTQTAVNNAFETSSGEADGSTSAEWATLIATKSNWTISLV